MKSDPEFNIEFVALIRNHPCIYDHTVTDYRNSNIQDQAWSLIATQLGASVHDCKERWKNLRGCFTRHLKSSQTSNLRKPYYLAEHLSFLLPFTTTRGKPSSSQSYTTILEIDDYEETSNNDDGNSRLSPFFPTSSHDDDGPSSSKKLKTETDVLMMDDPDLLFLKSLLPDMKEMSNRQKRKFKIDVLGVVSKILEGAGSSSSDNGFKITSSCLEQSLGHVDPLLLENVEVKREKDPDFH